MVIYFMLCDIFISLIIFVDLVYIRYFDMPPSVSSFPLLFSASPSETAVSALAVWKDLLLFPDIIILMFIAPGLAAIIEARDKLLSIKNFSLVLAVSVLLYSLMPLKCFIKKEAWFFTDIPLRTFFMSTPPVYHIADIVASLKHAVPYIISDNESKRIKMWFTNEEKLRKDNAFAAISEGKGRKKNLIIIQVESLENCLIGKKINGVEITPFLNRLTEKEVYFNHFYSQVLGGHSSDADFMVNTSLYPLLKGSVCISFPLNTYNALPLRLKEKGYTTAAFHGNGKGFWNRNKIFPNLGIDTFLAKGDLDQKDTIGLGVSDVSLFDQSIDKLKTIKKPFFAFFITLTSHFPYTNLPKNTNLPMEKAYKRDEMFVNYLYAINYTDGALEKFFQKLKEAKLANNTIVVIYGDHGAIPERYRDNFARKFYIDNVPLIISGLGVGNKIMENRGGQVDIFPTMAYIMGIDKEKYIHSVMGKNLFVDKRSFVVLPIKKSLFVDPNTCDLSCREHALQALDLSDSVIRGNYFKVPDNSKNREVKNADRN